MADPASTATAKRPSAIYVWIVPSEEVLEQPGSWRIRKWDTEPFPEANYTLQSAIAEQQSGLVPGLQHAVRVLRNNGFEKGAKAIEFQLRFLDEACTPSATQEALPPEVSALLNAYREERRLRLAINVEMGEQARLGNLWQNSWCKDWAAYEAATKRIPEAIDRALRATDSRGGANG